MNSLIVRLLLAAGGLAALACIGVGLTKTVYFARTSAAVSNARTGELLILVGCTAVLAIAVAVRGSAPTWISVLIALPVLVGGLTLVTDETLLPHFVALPTMSLALAGLVGMVASHR